MSRISGPEDDDKLRALRDFLARPEVQAGKVLIFSEAETTVEYLYRELNPNGQNVHIARLTGSTSHDAERMVKRFSPTWNLGVHASLCPVQKYGCCWRRTSYPRAKTCRTAPAC